MLGTFLCFVGVPIDCYTVGEYGTVMNFFTIESIFAAKKKDTLLPTLHSTGPSQE